MILLKTERKKCRETKTKYGKAEQLGQPDGGEQRCASRGVVQWPPLVTLGVGHNNLNWRVACSSNAMVSSGGQTKLIGFQEVAQKMLFVCSADEERSDRESDLPIFGISRASTFCTVTMAPITPDSPPNKAWGNGYRITSTISTVIDGTASRGSGFRKSYQVKTCSESVN